MFVRIVWWDLDGTPASVPALRRYLREESVEAFSRVAGLRLKTWIADDAADRWGAVYLWEDREAAAAARPLPSRAAELIGKGPDHVEEFEVEATVEGACADGRLGRRGRAFG